MATPYGQLAHACGTFDHELLVRPWPAVPASDIQMVTTDLDLGVQEAIVVVGITSVVPCWVPTR